MNERFQNVSGATVAFTDDAIVCHDSQKHRLFPYGGIDSIKVDFICTLTIVGHIGSVQKTFIYAINNIDELKENANKGSSNGGNNSNTSSTNVSIAPIINIVEDIKTIEDDSFNDLNGID